MKVAVQVMGYGGIEKLDLQTEAPLQPTNVEPVFGVALILTVTPRL